MSIPGSWFGKRLPPLRAGSFTCSGPMEDSPDVGTEVTEVMLICPVIWPAAAMTNGTWKNRQPLINQISNVSNVNMTLRPGVPSQAPINAQMLTKRQREILNQHLRQRQMQEQQQQQQQQQVQQRTLMMRGQGLNMTPSTVAPSGIPAAMSNPQIPQANAQQFPFPPNYRISQQPDPGFTGATTPQSPLVSPRMAHTQSPMMQQSQANPAYQPPSDMSGWAQGSMGGNSMFSQQSPPHFGQQANTSMYNNNMNISVSMATNTGGLSNMNQMSVLAWLPLQEQPLLTA